MEVKVVILQRNIQVVGSVSNKDADNNQGCVEEVGGGKWEEVGGSEGDQTYW